MTSKVIDIRTRRPVTDIPARAASQGIVGVAKRLAVGCTLENGTLRTHRYRDHLVLWDLTNAGKRGKKVTKLNVTPTYNVGEAHRGAIMEQIAVLLESLHSYTVAAAVLQELANVSQQLNVSSNEERGVDVAPASFKPLTIKTPILEVTASYSDFSIRCLQDKHNCPSACPPIRASKTAIQKFYAWATANQSRVASMSYRQLLDAMLEQGIRYHSYCAMD